MPEDPLPDALLDRPRNPRSLEHLSPYDRATVNLWVRSYAELSRDPTHGPLIEAAVHAVHAVLAGLRQYHQPPSLFAAYETNSAADFALIRSLLPGRLADEMLWRVRDAAFHLRWIEFTGSGQRGA